MKRETVGLPTCCTERKREREGECEWERDTHIYTPLGCDQRQQLQRTALQLVWALGKVL